MDEAITYTRKDLDLRGVITGLYSVSITVEYRHTSL